LAIEALHEAIDLLEPRREVMDRLVEALITEETLSSSRFYELAGLNQPQPAENQLKNNERNKPALAEKPAAT
jgi:cell division protease FtsH